MNLVRYFSVLFVMVFPGAGAAQEVEISDAGPKGRAFLSYLGLRSDPGSVEFLYHTSTDRGSSWSAPASLGSGHDRETMTSAWFGGRSARSA